MRAPGTYKTSRAFWRAVTDQARVVSKDEGRPVNEVLRQFIHERFLARVFSAKDRWVLKGGNAVLARFADARTTLDVDLLRELEDLDLAYEELIAAAKQDMGDHLRFEPVRGADGGHGADQPGVDGRRVVFDTYCGVKKLAPVKVDLVIGSIMTTSPEQLSKAVFDFEGVEPVRMKLYPVVDHIADKVCATQARYGSGDRGSSRVRDLVDLVVFARNQDLDGAKLTVALEQEWAARRLEGSLSFEPPPDWAIQYRALSRDVRACGEFTSFDSATSLIARLLEPVCTGEAAGQRWESASLRWTTIDDG